MLAKDLRQWLETVHDDATIELYYYSWTALDPKMIRATYQSQPPIPPRTMTDVCNLEEVTK